MMTNAFTPELSYFIVYIVISLLSDIILDSWYSTCV